MQISNRKLFATLWQLIVLSVHTGCAFRIEMYDETEYKGLFYDGNILPSTDNNCVNLPPVARRRASSLKTEACIMVYSEPGCDWYSFKITRGNHSNLAVFNHAGDNTTMDQSISSFHLCSDQIGTPGNIDLHGYYNGKLEPMVSYRDLCECIDTPKFSHGKIEKINNFGNCFEFFDTQNCRESGEKIKIEGGYSTGSNDLGLLRFDGRIRSLQPCETNLLMQDQNCGIKLNTVLKKISMSDTEPTTVRNAVMATKTIIVNDGPAEISQEFRTREEIEETYVVKRADMFNEGIFKSFTVDSDVNVEASLEYIPYVAADVNASVHTAYTRNQSNLVSESEETSSTHKRIRTFEVTEKITIPACTKYSVDSVVRIYENATINYVATVHITGSKSINTTAIEYEVHETIIATVGFEAIITGEGSPLTNCKSQ